MPFKGSDRQCMVVEPRLQYIEIFLEFNLRPIRHFYVVYLFSKSVNSIFKILIDSLLRDDFENRFFNPIPAGVLENQDMLGGGINLTPL